MTKDIFMIVHATEDAQDKANKLIITEYDDYFETYLSDYYPSRERAELALSQKILTCKENIDRVKNSIIGDFKQKQDLEDAQACRIVKATISVLIEE